MRVMTATMTMTVLAVILWTLMELTSQKQYALNVRRSCVIMTTWSKLRLVRLYYISPCQHRIRPNSWFIFFSVMTIYVMKIISTYYIFKSIKLILNCWCAHITFTCEQVILACIALLASVVELVVSIAVSALCCRVMCCRSRRSEVRACSSLLGLASRIESRALSVATPYFFKSIVLFFGIS